MAQSLFSESEHAQIRTAIGTAESHTSGEIRVHVERHCREDVLDHAAHIFQELEMHKTELRNGVLFYISFEDHKLAILGDAGINTRVEPNFWDEIKEFLIGEFKKSNYLEGLSKAIEMAGIQLKKYFPVAEDDVNELSNEISFGKTV